MEKQKLSFNHLNGNVEGIYINAGNNTPLVIIVNGHNGFYNYGMFPYIQEKFFGSNISSYSFNYSHGGVIGDKDRFDDLEKYEKNCMRLEIEDLVCVIENLKKSILNVHSKVTLLAHSLGGVPAIFSAEIAAELNIQLAGLILVSTVSTLNFYPPEMLSEWNTTGVFYKKNNRTLQDLPLGFEFLQEVLKSDTVWSLKNKIEKLTLPIIIIHGDKDEAVSVNHANDLYSWAKTPNNKVRLEIIPDATHTFNTKHPFTQTSEQLEKLISLMIIWINGDN